MGKDLSPENETYGNKSELKDECGKQSHLTHSGLFMLKLESLVRSDHFKASEDLREYNYFRYHSPRWFILCVWQLLRSTSQLVLSEILALFVFCRLCEINPRKQDRFRLGSERTDFSIICSYVFCKPIVIAIPCVKTKFDPLGWATFTKRRVNQWANWILKRCWEIDRN